MKKAFLAVLLVLTTVFCLAGCQENSDTEQAEQTGTEIQQTTAAGDGSGQESGQTNESADASGTEMTEASETEAAGGEEGETEAAEEISEEISEEELGAEAEPEETVSSALDPKIVFTKDCYDNDSYINLPMFLSQPEGSDAKVYVMIADDSRQWDYYEYVLGESYTTSEYVIIEHDGIFDEIPCQWIERFQDPFTVYAADYDGDGKTELAAIRYSVGGTFCAVYELYIFKLVDGHYQCFTADNNSMTDYIFYQIDDGGKNIEFTVKDSDASFKMDISSLENFNGVEYGSVVEYFAEGNKLKVKITIFAVEFMPSDSLELTMNVNFSNGEFTCSGPVFKK